MGDAAAIGQLVQQARASASRDNHSDACQHLLRAIQAVPALAAPLMVELRDYLAEAGAVALYHLALQVLPTQLPRRVFSFSTRSHVARSSPARVPTCVEGEAEGEERRRLSGGVRTAASPRTPAYGSVATYPSRLRLAACYTSYTRTRLPESVSTTVVLT